MKLRPLKQLARRSTTDHNTLQNYAEQMMQIMRVELENWEKGTVGQDLVNSETVNSLIPSLKAGSYEAMDKKALVHEFFHLVCVAEYDSCYLEDIESCLRALHSQVKYDIDGFWNEIFDSLPLIQQNRLLNKWDKIKGKINANSNTVFKEMITQKMDTLKIK